MQVDPYGPRSPRRGRAGTTGQTRLAGFVPQGLTCDIQQTTEGCHNAQARAPHTVHPVPSDPSYRRCLQHAPLIAMLLAICTFPITNCPTPPAHIASVLKAYRSLLQRGHADLLLDRQRARRRHTYLPFACAHMYVHAHAHPGCVTRERHSLTDGIATYQSCADCSP
jgi:hypothetical protein